MWNTSQIYLIDHEFPSSLNSLFTMESCEKATFHSRIQSNTGWIQHIILGVKYSFRGEGSKKTRTDDSSWGSRVPTWIFKNTEIVYLILLSYTYKFSHMWYSLTQCVLSAVFRSWNIWACCIMGKHTWLGVCSILHIDILIIVYCVLHANMTIKYGIPADSAHCYKLKQHVVSGCIHHNLNSPSYHQTKMFITNVNLLYSTFSSIILLIFIKYQTCWRFFYTKWNVRVPVFSTFVSTHTGCCQTICLKV